MNTKLNGQHALSLDEIFAQRELPKEFVPVPEWGEGGVWISVMNGLQRDAWESAIAADRANARAKLVVYAAVTADGQPLFQPEQVDQVGKLNAIALARLATVALRINRLSTGAMEDTKGN